MSAEHRVIVKVEPTPNTAAGWLTKCKAVNVTASAAATTTLVSIAALLTQLGSDTQLLDLAQSKVPHGGKAETTARDAQWRLLQKSLRAFVAGVQGLCDAAPDVAHAQSIAAAAGLDTRLPAVRVTVDPRAKALGNGTVALFGRRPVARRSGAYYEWSMSSDGGKTWASITGTNDARTQVSGLTPGASISFRYRTTFKNVTSDWSQAFTVIVH